jgi:hypothetical protein
LKQSCNKIAIATIAMILSACIGAPEPLPTPRTFLSPMQYLPFAARPSTFGRGGALTYSAVNGCEDARRILARWAYNWTQDGPTCPGIITLPMTWHRDPATCPVLGPGQPILLWNEPSNAGAWGTAVSPDEAIALTRKLTLCYPDRQLATPAEFGGQGGADATVWLSAWWNGYTAKYGAPPPISIMATHCYAGDAQTCIASLSRDIAWATARNIPVLVTEWGIVPKWAGSSERAMREADELLRWMQNQPEIIGEAFFSTRQTGYEGWWFGGPTTATIDMQSGGLTAWGAWYAGCVSR